MNPYILFYITGIKNIAISGENHSFPVENQGSIVSIDVLMKKYCLEGIKVWFSEDTFIDQVMKENAYQLVELFLINIIGKLNAMADKFTIQENQIYNPNEVNKDGIFTARTTIGIECSTLAIPIYSIEQFSKIFSGIPSDSEKRDRLLVFSSIMKIENIAIRYLIQYEFLMSLVSARHRQKDVTDYINHIFNPSDPTHTIGFHQTRRPGKTFSEDDITYLRNILAHNDSNAIPEKINQIISGMSQAINEVIFFCLDTTP